MGFLLLSQAVASSPAHLSTPLSPASLLLIVPMAKNGAGTLKMSKLHKTGSQHSCTVDRQAGHRIYHTQKGALGSGRGHA